MDSHSVIPCGSSDWHPSTGMPRWIFYRGVQAKAQEAQDDSNGFNWTWTVAHLVCNRALSWVCVTGVSLQLDSFTGGHRRPNHPVHVVQYFSISCMERRTIVPSRQLLIEYWTACRRLALQLPPVNAKEGHWICSVNWASLEASQYRYYAFLISELKIFIQIFVFIR